MTGLRIHHDALVFCVLFLNGCLFRADPGAASQPTRDADSGKTDSCRDSDCACVGADCTKTDQGPPPPPFSTALTGVIQQPVRWASCDVSINAARVARGLSNPITASYSGMNGLGLGPPMLDPRLIYAELDLKLVNKGTTEVDYTARDTWDLVLASGQRLTSVDALGVSILPGDTISTSLHYQVADGVDLRGATLVLNGPARETLEPEQVPLDRVYVQEFPRRMVSMVGQTATFHPAGSDPGSVHIDEAVYDVNDARDGRSARGKRIVWMNVAFTSAWSLGFFDSGELRIVLDGRASAPNVHQTALLAEGVTKVLHTAFDIDEAASRFEIVIPDGTAEGHRLAVNVADTVLADIP